MQICMYADRWSGHRPSVIETAKQGLRFGSFIHGLSWLAAKRVETAHRRSFIVQRPRVAVGKRKARRRSRSKLCYPTNHTPHPTAVGTENSTMWVGAFRLKVGTKIVIVTLEMIKQKKKLYLTPSLAYIEFVSLTTYISNTLTRLNANPFWNH